MSQSGKKGVFVSGITGACVANANLMVYKKTIKCHHGKVVHRYKTKKSSSVKIRKVNVTTSRHWRMEDMIHRGEGDARGRKIGAQGCLRKMPVCWSSRHQKVIFCFVLFFLLYEFVKKKNPILPILQALLGLKQFIHRLFQTSHWKPWVSFSVGHILWSKCRHIMR